MEELIYQQKYLKYKKKYLEILQLGGSFKIQNIERGETPDIIYFKTTSAFSYDKKTLLQDFLSSIGLQVINIENIDNDYIMTFKEKLTDEDFKIINNIFIICNDSGYKNLDTKFKIIPWISNSTKSKLLYISLKIDPSSSFGKELKTTLGKISLHNPFEGPDEKYPHISLCNFNIKKNSKLDNFLSLLNTREQFFNFAENIIKVITNELFVKQIMGSQLSSTPGEYKELGKYFSRVYDGPIDMDPVRKEIINILLKKIGITQFYEKDINVFKKKFKFYYDDNKLLNDDDIKLNSQIAQGEYEIIRWKPHISILPIVDLKDEIKGQIIKSDTLSKLNLWPSHTSRNFNIGHQISEQIKGDFNIIHFAYGHYVDKYSYEFELPHLPSKNKCKKV
jgi:hypothetical protein